MKKKKLRVLIASPVSMLPPTSGNSARIFQLYTVLKEVFKDCIIDYCLITTSEMQNRFDGHSMPEYLGENFHLWQMGNSATDSLTYKLFRVFKKLFGSFSTKIADYLPVDLMFSRKQKLAFKRLVLEISPDVLICEYVLLAPILELVPDNIITIVDTHDKFGNRNARLRAESENAGLWWSLTMNQEKRLLEKFDYALAIQKTEGDYFHSIVDNNKVNVVTLDILNLPSVFVSHEHSFDNTIGFIGSNNGHNNYGLTYFIERCWPKILEANPKAKLLVAGTVKINLNDDIKNVYSLGLVNNVLDDFYKKCSFVINPCFTGSGLKIKTIEALSYGLPVVSTAEGATGIEDFNNKGLLIKDICNNDFIDACLMLLNDINFLRESGLNARKSIQQSYLNSKNSLKDIII